MAKEKHHKQERELTNVIQCSETETVQGSGSEEVSQQESSEEILVNTAVGKCLKNTLYAIESELLQAYNNAGKFPDFKVGDTIKVHVSIREGSRERVQTYEGVVLCFKNGMHRKTFTVRRVSSGVAIERVFCFHSPAISSVDVVRRAKVRRAKLYFLRGRFGKAARLKELILKKSSLSK